MAKLNFLAWQKANQVEDPKIQKLSIYHPLARKWTEKQKLILYKRYKKTAEWNETCRFISKKYNRTFNAVNSKLLQLIKTFKI